MFREGQEAAAFFKEQEEAKLFHTSTTQCWCVCISGNSSKKLWNLLMHQVLISTVFFAGVDVRLSAGSVEVTSKMERSSCREWWLRTERSSKYWRINRSLAKVAIPLTERACKRQIVIAFLQHARTPLEKEEIPSNVLFIISRTCFYKNV